MKPSFFLQSNWAKGLIVFSISLLASCFSFLSPIIYAGLAKYAIDNGSDVSFSITVTNNPTSVTCFNGNVVMSGSGNGVYTGTADYTNDLVNSPGTNTVSCTASNSAGSSTITVGFIELIPNVAPEIVMLPTVSICGNDGTLVIDEPLVDFVATTNVTGAAYTLTAGTLPSGLSIDSTNGNLIGTAAAGDFNPNALKMTATTIVGSDESNVFTIDINEAACP